MLPLRLQSSSFMTLGWALPRSHAHASGALERLQTDGADLPQETEQDKILFYYPASSSLSQQLSDVGLSEAFVNFSRTFSPDRWAVLSILIELLLSRRPSI